jgi:ABC-type multidrug transport system ATPase subunit/pSer/pThr/pTyr-binding forkhead associated (FHA) protein
MPYRLVHLTGSLAGQQRPIDPGAAIILGRDPQSAHVVFGTGDRLVSRRHASLREEGGVLILRDLESSTGTFVDGVSIEEAELQGGDVFELGPGGPRLRVETADGGTVVLSRAAVPAPPVTAPVASAAAMLAPLSPSDRLSLQLVSGSRKGETIDAGGRVVRLGRAAGNTVAFPGDATVSAQHAKIVRLDDGFVLVDLESTNGTYVNGRRIDRARLRSGDRVNLSPGGPALLALISSGDGTGSTVTIPNFAEIASRRSEAAVVEEVELTETGLRIGRGEDADVRLDSPIVSQAHARIVRGGDSVALFDLGSTNGTYVNGERVDRHTLADGDRIVIGPYQLEVDGRVLKVQDTRRRTDLRALGLVVTAEGRRILDDVSLELAPGSFTAIVGPSGSGKSTLLKALNGARPAEEGRVLVSGVDLYAAPESLRGTIAYVPQDDIVHAELTPAECLDYTARLRLPRDTTPAERARRVAAVLESLELGERQHVPIHRLSGGQRKRVSIAVELLTDPDLLFLDEPASGLDPGLEESLMLLLRELSFKGKTVVIVTHTLDHIHLCDTLVLLAEGRRVFTGKPADALQRFGVTHPGQLYTRLKERSGAEWIASFAETGTPPAPPAVRASAPRRAARKRSGQLVVLAARYLKTVTRDRRNALLLVGQAPLVAALIGLSLLYGASDVAYTKPKNTLLFLLSLTAVWFGCSNAARELVKERGIFLRERMVGLRALPYVTSKLVVLSGLSLVQCVAFLLILNAWFGIPGRAALLLGAMLLSAAVGLLLGLVVSALARTSDRAMTLLPILLIPQVLFTFPAVQLDMKGPAGIVARAMPTWWSFDLLRRIALAPDEALGHEAIDARLAEGKTALMTRGRFEAMLREGYPMWNYRSAVEVTWTAAGPERWGAALPASWGGMRPVAVDVAALGLMGVALFAIAVRKETNR